MKTERSRDVNCQPTLFESVLKDRYKDYLTILIRGNYGSQPLSPEEIKKFSEYVTLLVKSGANKRVPKDKTQTWHNHVRTIIGNKKFKEIFCIY